MGDQREGKRIWWPEQGQWAGGCGGGGGTEDVQKAEVIGPGAPLGAGGVKNRGEEGGVYRMLQPHAWLAADGDVPKMGSPRGSLVRCSDADVLSLRGQKGVPAKIPGHQEAVGSVGQERSQSWGAGLDITPVVVVAEFPPREGGPCRKSCGRTNIQDREQRKSCQEVAGEEAARRW